MSSGVLSSQGDAQGFYTTVINNEMIDFSLTPLSSITIESDTELLLKINGSNSILHTKFCIFTDVIITTIQVMMPIGTKIKWSALLC